MISILVRTCTLEGVRGSIDASTTKEEGCKVDISRILPSTFKFMSINNSKASNILLKYPLDKPFLFQTTFFTLFKALTRINSVDFVRTLDTSLLSFTIDTSLEDLEYKGERLEALLRQFHMRFS